MPTRSRRRRILSIAIGGALALVVLVWLVLPLVLGPILRNKLQSLVSNHLRAELKLADLSYRFPYTVTVTDARIVARDGPHAGHELLRLARGRLTLDELPTGTGPLRIKSIELERPSLHVVRDARGNIAGDQVLRGGDAPRPNERMKLSDLFRLRKLTLRGGRVVYTDATRPYVPPMVWDNLTTDLRIAPREAAVYEFRYRAGGAPLAELSAEGSIDIDRLVMVVERLALSGRADPEADSSSVPAFVYEFVQKHEIAGAVRVEGDGTIPLREPQSSSFQASVTLDGARAHVYRYDRTLERLDLRVELEKRADARAIDLRVPTLRARASPAEVTLADASGAVDWASQTWRLSVPRAQAEFHGDATSQPASAPASSGSVALALDVAGSLDRGRIHWDRTSGRATLDDVTLRLPRFERPLEHVSGSLQIADGAAVVEQLRATYGSDVWTAAAARVDLTNLPDGFDVTGVAGEVNFAQPSPPYPKGFGKVVAALRPQGLFSVTGGFARDRETMSGPRTRWDFIVGSDGGAFTVTGRDIALTSIRGEAHVTRDEIEVRRFLANTFDGALAATGTIDPRKPVSYRGEISVENVDLQALVERLRKSSNEAKYTVTGRLGGSASIESDGGSLEMLRAVGELVIHDGVLWEAPVLSDVVGRTRVARDALRAGEAAAVLEMHDGVVHVRHAAIASPALGLQGWGTIDLRDGARAEALNLNVVAAPLGDWEKHLRKTNVPIISDVAGALAGAMQRVLNTATSTLLYEFRVSGALSKPQLSAVPTPVLTEAAAFVFEGMLRKDRDLMKRLRARGGRQDDRK